MEKLTFLDIAVLVNSSCQSVFAPPSAKVPPAATTCLRNSSALNTSTLLANVENAVDTERFIWVLPTFPFLVVITITPFAALEPYIAAAEASFNTSILSIS